MMIKLNKDWRTVKLYRLFVDTENELDKKRKYFDENELDKKRKYFDENEVDKKRKNFDENEINIF